METMKKPSVIPVVIPVYNPPGEFEPFVDSLRKNHTAPIVIVNDGSHPSFNPLFRRLVRSYEASLLVHTKNKGKGAALKTAMQHILRTMPEAGGIITADADGQHVAHDILICDALARKSATAFLIGTRVTRSNMPLKSRTGNALTRGFLRLLHGTHVGDTQSGLRYIPAGLMEQCVGSVFDKYDFELDMIVQAINAGIPIVEFPIETIYLNKNRASHYKILKDSWYVARVFVHHLGRRLRTSRVR